MIHKQSILTAIAILLLGAMTLTDAHLLSIEVDEIMEGKELEKEDVKEGSEKDLDFLKLLIKGGMSGSFQAHTTSISLKTQFFRQKENTDQKVEIPLFLLNCCWKLPSN